jgi:predicted alpha/beta-fold hydrolase
MLLVNAQDDPLIPEELLETPKKYVYSMYDCSVVKLCLTIIINAFVVVFRTK